MAACNTESAPGASTGPLGDGRAGDGVPGTAAVMGAGILVKSAIGGDDGWGDTDGTKVGLSLDNLRSDRTVFPALHQVEFGWSDLSDPCFSTTHRTTAGGSECSRRQPMKSHSFMVW